MGQTSIPVTETARDELAKTKPDGMSWSEYLIALRDESDQLKTAEFGADESAIARRVVDDLTTQLPPAIAEELEGRR